MIKLRPYQQAVKAEILQQLEAVRAVLAVMPTGSGKTVTFASLMHDHDGAAGAIVHRKEIVGQISLALGAVGIVHRVIAPDATVRLIRRKHLSQFGQSYIDQNAQTGVASVQTLTSKSSERSASVQAWIKQLTLCVYDEGHHYVDSGLWAKAVDVMHNAKLLFVTATPERADGKGLGAHASGYAEAMIEGPTVKWLMDNGYLSRYEYYAPTTDLDIEGVAVTASGDFNAKALRQRTVESHLVGDVIKQYKQFADGRRAIGFASDVATAEEMAQAAISAGYRSAALSGATEQGERDRVLQQFEKGDIDILFNVDLFDEGFDVPAVECCILARATMSLCKYLQMVGRALRVIEGKDKAIIIDPVRNWERHGMPDWPRQWTLDGRTKGGRGSDGTIPQRVCLSCTQPYLATQHACPYCGAEFIPPERKAPEQVDGDLIMLDSEALAALFAAKEKANKSDEDYKREQIARGLPPIARSADLRRHQAAKHRREVLHNLIGWWVGCQEAQGRDDRENQRRFYHRFGVDLISAFTLDAKATDALIDKITNAFHLDVS